MKLKSAISAAMLAMVGTFGVSFSPQPSVQAEVIPYQCFDASGNVAFTTTNPQETYGWRMGCRQMRYISNDPSQRQVAYYDCYDEVGNILMTTTNPEDAERLDNHDKVTCRKIGYRNSAPLQAQPIYYECYSRSKQVAFTTIYSQDTFGWLWGCKEVLNNPLPGSVPNTTTTPAPTSNSSGR